MGDMQYLLKICHAATPQRQGRKFRPDFQLPIPRVTPRCSLGFDPGASEVHTRLDGGGSHRPEIPFGRGFRYDGSFRSCLIRTWSMFWPGKSPRRRSAEFNLCMFGSRCQWA